jgi:hypothetical protein
MHGKRGECLHELVSSSATFVHKFGVQVGVQAVGDLYFYLYGYMYSYLAVSRRAASRYIGQLIPALLCRVPSQGIFIDRPLHQARTPFPDALLLLPLIPASSSTFDL